MEKNMEKNLGEIKTIFGARKNYLEKLIAQLERRLKKAPPGTVNINTSKGKTQFFHRTDSKSTVGKYIQQKDFAFAKALVQKSYDEKSLRSAKQELEAIDKYLKLIPKVLVEEVFGSLHIERQKLIEPISETDEQFVQRWETEDYEKKRITDDVPLIQTENGERVRSKSEMIIANILYREGIPFRYESALILKGKEKLHPDFTALNVRKRKIVYWEHLGMMDEPSYAEKALARLELLEENGIMLGDNLIVTSETRNKPLNPQVVKRKIEKYLR